MSAAEPVSGEPRVVSVSELVAGVRELLEESVGRLWIAGEISNLHLAASGHAYFTLKDAQAQVRAALFRGAARRMAFEPEDGLEVLVHAEVTVYERRGDLQIIVRHMEPRGRGALQLAFEQLRARLESEGLFDPSLKRPLPEHPRVVGVVTSPSGAAVRDVIEVSGERSPGTPLWLAASRVQGEGAELELSAALARLAGRPEVDVILIVRGGGSLEDLQPFNTEQLARAIRACPVPVVSGVGHEVDLTICDLAADARAPTPSAAAARALPDGRALAARLERDRRGLEMAMDRWLERAASRHQRSARALRAHSPLARLAAQRARFEAAVHALRREMRAAQGRAGARLAATAARFGAQSPKARLAAQRARVAAALHALERGVASRKERAAGRLAAAVARLDALSPLAVLTRGYALVQRAEDGAVVRAASDVGLGAGLRIRLARGSLEARVSALHEPASDEESPQN